MPILVLQSLSFLFLLLLFIVCRKKGIRSLLSLALTVLLLLKIFLPLLFRGYSPVITAFVLALPILALIIYLTEGFTRFSHIALSAIVANFTFITILSWLSITIAGFTGLTSEETAYVGGYGSQSINLQGLLIAGMLFGTLGVLTEMVVTQMATVSELLESGTTTDKRQIFRQAYTIGVAHLGSMINTLFLIYAGISLPILIILVRGEYHLAELVTSPLLGTEIIRTLVGAIGLIIAMPTSTALGVWWLKKGCSDSSILKID